MAKNDNKELHSILEQLKKSYSEVDGSLDAENEASESTTDANDDFQKLLTNFFSTDFVEEKNEDTYNFNVIEEKVEYNDEPEKIIEEIVEEPTREFIEEPEVEEPIEEFIEEPEIEELIEEFIEEPEIEELIEEFIEEPEIEELIEEFIEEPEIDEPIEEFIEEPEIEEPTPEVIPTVTENILAEPINKTGRDEVTAVENVFRIMFGAKQPQKEYAETPIEEAPEDEYYEDYDIVENDIVEDEIFEEPIVEEAFDDSFDEISISYESDKENSDEIFYSDDEDDEDEIFEDYEYAKAEEFDDSYDFKGPIIEYDDDDLTPVAYMEEDISKEEEEPYYYDPLQGHLSDAVYLVHKSVDEKLEFNTRQREIDLDDDDISLLLDFGYDDEIKSEAGAGRTNEIKRQKKSGKAPQKSERILGYSGDEYMGHAQDKDIKSNYIYDKKKIIVRIAFVAVLAIVMLGLSILYHANLYIDRAIYPYVEILALLMTAAVAASGLIEGARGIAKLDPKNYSIPVFLMIVQFIYDVFAIALQSSADSDSKMITCGFVVILYVGVSLVADALECSAQMNTFEVISSDGRLYSAEKFIKPKNEGNDKSNSRTVSSNVMLGNCIYKVKETDTAHGYFSRMSQKSDKCLRIMYFMGILPIVALIMGCVSLIENGDTYVALTSVMTVMFMGFPLSFTLFRAIPYFYMTKKLMEDKCAIVGDVSGCDYADVDMIMFDDVDAVKVTESIEIRPEGNPDVATAIKVASRAFKALGGPLSRILATEPGDDEATINIVSIRDNGIEFYMDSYLHVVIGDKNFMSIHGMKVSSDSKIISSSDDKATAVLYVAFNGVPQLGYIVSSKINEEFLNTVKNLADNGIKTAVETYSPLVNDYYFEANKPHGVASAVVHKPTVFEPKDKTHFVDGGMFSIGEPTKIANTLIEAKKYLRYEFQNKRFSTMMAILGIVLGIITVIFAAIINDGTNIGIFSCILIFLFNAISVFGIIFKHLDLKSKMKRK